MQIKGDCRVHILRILMPGAEITFLWGQVNSLNWWDRSCSRQRPHLFPWLIASLPLFWIELQSFYFLSLETPGQVSTGMLCKQRGRLSRHQNCFSQVFPSQAQSVFLQIAWNAALSLTILCWWRPGLRLGGPAVWPQWKYLKPKPKYYRPYANARAQGIAEQSPVWWRSSCMRVTLFIRLSNEELLGSSCPWEISVGQNSNPEDHQRSSYLSFTDV